MHYFLVITYYMVIRTLLLSYTTDMVIEYVITTHSVYEHEGPVELCVSFMTPPSLDQVPDLQFFLSAATNPGTASMLRLHRFSSIHIRQDLG